MMLFALTFKGDVRDWCISLPQVSIVDFVQFEDLFRKSWATDADGDIVVERFYRIQKGSNEDVRTFIQIFDRVVRDIPDYLKPTNAQILDKFIKVVQGHLTYQLGDKKPKTLAEAKEISVEIYWFGYLWRSDVDTIIS